MYQLTQLAADRHRQRLSQPPSSSAPPTACSRWPGPPAAPSAPSGGCAAPPARPGGCATSSQAQTTHVGSDHTAGHSGRPQPQGND